MSADEWLLESEEQIRSDRLNALIERDRAVFALKDAHSELAAERRACDDLETALRSALTDLQYVRQLLAEAQGAADADARIIGNLKRELQRTKDLLEVANVDLQAARWAITFP